MLHLFILMVVSWLVLGVYGSWFFFKAKTLQPMSYEDLFLTWKLHRQQAECEATGLSVFRNRNDKVVGFRCECGYEFQQERLITQKICKHNGSPKEPPSSSK